MPITNDQLAEILMGVARAQYQILNAIADPAAKRSAMNALGGLAGHQRGPQAPLDLQSLFPQMVLEASAAPRPNMLPHHVYYARELDKLIP